jgi:NifU-like protein involved in Fe-S cluster formation
MATNYTQKVMEHMENPHNVGKIDDADGVGKVGNPVCLLPATRVHLNDELEHISSVKANRRVLTHTGYYSDIDRVSHRGYKGKMLALKSKLGKVTLTPDHLVLAIRLPKRHRFFYTNRKRMLAPAWHHAEDLERRDVALYPIMKEEKDIRYIPLEVKKLKYDYRSKDLPERVEVDDGFMRLSGYYLSEGYVKDKVTKTFLCFTFNIKEEEYVQDVVSIVKAKFGLDAKVKRIPARKTAHVFVYSAGLARFFKRLFGVGAAYKRVPQEFMLLPPRKQRALIKGLWRGDGHMSTARKWPRAGYATVSEELAQQMKVLLLRQHIVPSIYVEGAKEAKGVKHKQAYRIHVGDKDSLRKLASIMGVSFDYAKTEKTHSWFDNNFLYTPITSIESAAYDGDVFNLEVAGAHSFVTDSFCVHNCGDVMSMYIKVKGDKIVDIKFKTYGCGAAIATSSMMTDMVKGKTIAEAEKITKDQLAKELGGLPVIKLHCSVLAVDALHEAIKDYRSKQK